ncbi:hypothetical protein ACL2XP_05050 [Sodalis sp. RH21]|uniref:hypothetical protein n=1 Tax=unclassified Sodalis (in: enterobacteria) TaxID=2636512 RepID=UPI0039B59A5E
MVGLIPAMLSCGAWHRLCAIRLRDCWRSAAGTSGYLVKPISLTDYIPANAPAFFDLNQFNRDKALAAKIIFLFYINFYAFGTCRHLKIILKITTFFVNAPGSRNYFTRSHKPVS